MYEYEVRFIETGEVSIIFGYNLNDACARAGIFPTDIEVIQYEYVD